MPFSIAFFITFILTFFAEDKTEDQSLKDDETSYNDVDSVRGSIKEESSVDTCTKGMTD